MYLTSIVSGLLILGATSQVAAADQKCYYPDGSEEENYSPCRTANSDSACCGPNALCLTNGLCLVVGNQFSNRISRAGCTDKTWNSPECPKVCLDSYPDSGIGLQWATVDSDGNAKWCCGASYDSETQQCRTENDNSPDPFTIANSEVIFDRVTGSTQLSAAFGEQNDGNAPSSSSLSSGASSTPTSRPPVSSSSADSSICPTCEKPSNNEVAVGAGVGVPLGVALLVALGFLWQQRRSNKMKEVELHHLQQYPGSVRPHYGEDGSQMVTMEKGQGQGVQELSSGEAVVEKDGRLVSELPSSPQPK